MSKAASEESPNCTFTVAEPKTRSKGVWSPTLLQEMSVAKISLDAKEVIQKWKDRPEKSHFRTQQIYVLKAAIKAVLKVEASV